MAPLSWLALSLPDLSKAQLQQSLSCSIWLPNCDGDALNLLNYLWTARWHWILRYHVKCVLGTLVRWTRSAEGEPYTNANMIETNQKKMDAKPSGESDVVGEKKVEKSHIEGDEEDVIGERNDVPLQ